MPRESRPVIAVLTLFVAAALVMDLVNGRFWMSDFRVYHGAAVALMEGTPVYGVPFGEDTGFFKYAPIVCLLFIPAALLPWKFAGLLHFMFMGLALVAIFIRAERLLMRHMLGMYAPRIAVRGFLLFACTAVLLAREFHLGNINLFLILGVLMATEALLEDRHECAGMVFGMVWLTKPYLAFLVLPLLVFRRWTAMRTAVVTVSALTIVPLLILGPVQWYTLHEAWLKAMAEHSGYLTSPDTFSALAARWLPTAWGPIGAIPVVIATGTLLFLLSTWCARTTRSPRQDLPLLLWTAFALVPHLVITDQEHFLYSMPLLAWTLARSFHQPTYATLTLFSTAMLLYATRSSDLWGTRCETSWVRAGALGLGDLLLIATAWVSRIIGGSAAHASVE